MNALVAGYEMGGVAAYANDLIYCSSFFEFVMKQMTFFLP
jgi:hypothetical protein